VQGEPATGTTSKVNNQPIVNTATYTKRVGMVA